MKLILKTFLVLFLLTSCAPKEEDIIALTGNYRAVPDATNGVVACWLTADVDAGNNSSLNIKNNMDITNAQSFTIGFSGREFQIEIIGTVGSCVSKGTYAITSRTSASNGNVTFLTTSSTCTSNNTATIFPLGSSGSTISVNSKPDSTFSLSNNFVVGNNGSEIYIQLPLDLNFASTNWDINCQQGLCTCFFKMPSL